jgi:hypothetical protein
VSKHLTCSDKTRSDVERELTVGRELAAWICVPLVVVKVTPRRVAGTVHDGVPAHVRILPSLADALIADPVQSEAAMLCTDELEVLCESRIKVRHVCGLSRLQANERSTVHRIEPVFQSR